MTSEKNSPRIDVENQLESLDSLQTSLKSEEYDFPDGGWRANGVVLGSFVGLIVTFGLLNSVGTIQSYISSHQLKDTDTSTVSWIFSIFLWLSFFFGGIVGPLFDNQGSRKLLIIGTCLMFVGFMTMSISTTLYQFILCFSLCIGIGNCIIITPLVGSVSHWFLYKRGIALGIATLGGSVGGACIPLLLRSLFPKIGFAWSIRVLGFFTLFCMGFATLLLKERFKRPFLIERNPSKLVNLKIFCQNIFDLTAFKDTKFTLLVIATFLNELSLLLLLTYLSSYATTQGMSDSQAYFLVTILNLTGLVGRFLPNILSDYIGYFNVMITMLIGYVISCLLIWVPFGSNIQALYAFAVIAGFFVSSILSLTPACLGVITSTNQFGLRYGLLYTFVSLGLLFGIPMGAAVIGDGSPERYQFFAILCGLLSSIGVCFFIGCRYCIVSMKINVKV
ncbi:monocarboxylate permease [Hyphopichia burtonii NRRL Y-1933]|uniref:Monocarboxylate permease n=1 Tax=Hyphopichia burtonii NRRL Y-1933 TaxID=984485 RepID=A0A1E4RT26_9ASCO|nr:monocarboxylate permease [Hyphopichia burtonii NRRL Y-1933]ODV70388.1 monocarboxylate permease [Hyphopichia burtonii NRRL Y-1933]